MQRVTSALLPRVLWFTVSVALASCGGERASAPASPATAPASAPALFELGELTVFEGKDAMIKVHADGSSELASRTFRPGASGEPAASDATQIRWEPGPTLRPDGTIEYHGAPALRVLADGSVTDLRTGQPAPFTIAADRVTLTGPRASGSIALAADGTLTFGGGNGAPRPDALPHAEGANTPGKRRVVLALVGLLLGGAGHVEAVPGAGPSTPPR